ncbi:MAG TPA: AsmA-like C-terminal region-containing protein [Longimicrobiales bacterium]|nr:AsmA-like C-terminal region-containing protein [Longimicrobiales bacterium]
MTPKHKKILVAVGAVVAVVLLLLLSIPVFFEGRIERRLQAEVEERTGLQVTWDDVGLSLLRDFPHVTLSILELDAVGTDRFQGDTLASIGSLRVALDLGSVVRALRDQGPFVVRSVRLEEPVVGLRVLEDGTASWDPLSREAERAASEEAMGPGRGIGVELRSFELTDGRLVYDNARSGLYVSLEGLRHSLSGNFSRESLVASTQAHADRTTVRFAGTPYLPGVALDLEAEVEVDREQSRVRLLDNELRLNELALAFSGEAARQADGIALDVTFAAPRTEFGEILSLVPAVYATDFASLETSGTFALEGHVRGIYSDGSVPSFALLLAIDDGSFRYPDLPLAARAISADLAIDNPGGDVDSTVVRLNRLHFEIDGQPVEGALALRTPLSDPEVDVRVQGTLDLASLARTVKLEGLDELAGVVTADAAVHARRSDVDSARYERVAAEGSIGARDLALTGESFRQPILVEEAAIQLTPQFAELRSLRARAGSSDVQATGRLDNLLGFALWDQPLRGAASFTSGRVVLDEWRSGDALSTIPVPPRLDLTLDGAVEELTYGTLEMTNARGRAHVADERLTLDGFRLETLGGRMGLDGHYETTDPAEPTFAFDLTMDSLDVAGAAASFTTVRTLAPVARYARGTFSADMSVSGALQPDMTPVFDELDGSGSVTTSRIAIEGFPLLERMAEAVAVPRIAQPTVEALRSTVRIEDGRLHVEPFQAAVAGFAMSVSGSNGIDQSLDYTLGLMLPRSGLGDAAAQAVQDLAARAGLGGAAGLPDSVRMGVRVGGTVTDPTVSLGLDETAQSVGSAAGRAAEAAVEERVDEARQRLDAEAEEARQRARARADSLVAEAEQRAEAVRAEARRAAEAVRVEGNRAADEVLARASGPVARTAAQPVADRLRREAEERATALEREADERAAALVAEARERADALVGPGGN